MKPIKGMIYSFDAYIAVVISLIGVIMLINYYSIEANYIDYYQAKTLTLDLLRVMMEKGYLKSPSLYSSEISFTLENSIPQKYSYRLRATDSSGNENIIASSLSNVDEYKKFKVASSLLVPVVEKSILTENPYSYITCQGTVNACSTSTKKSLIFDSVYFSKVTLEVSI